MNKKAQEIRDQLRRLETEAAHLVAEEPSFRRTEHKIMNAAMAADDWLSINKGKAPKEKPAAPQQQPQQPPQQPQTRESLIAEFEKLNDKDFEKARKHIEFALAKNPDRADAKFALEAINEVAKKKPAQQ